MAKKTQAPRDSDHKTAEKVRGDIFSYALLPQEECKVIFAEMDAILRNAINRMLDEEMFFVEDYFRDLVLRVISGNTLSKNLYEKNDREDVSKKKTKVLQPSELRFLKSAFNLLRPDLTLENKKHIIARSRFLRGMQEDAVSYFMVCAEKIRQGETIYVNYLGNYDVEKILALHAEILPSWNLYNQHKETLVKPYLRLVYKQAGDKSTTDSQTLENFQNGYAGLTRAIRQYTPSRFAVFSLVAKTWIDQAILYNIKNEGNFIKLPVGVWNAYQKFEKIRKSLHSSTGQDVSEEVIAEAAGVDIAKVKRTYDAIKLTKVVSLDVPTSNEEEQGGGPSWNKESIETPENIQERIEMLSEFSLVEGIVDQFTEETRLIFGLATGCINLIKDPEFTKEELEKETIMQRMATHRVEVIF